MGANTVSLNFKARVPVFDANVRVGDRHDEVSACPDRATLLAEMDRHGVGRALIHHAQGEELSAIDGNLALESWLAADDQRLVPQWAVVPVVPSLQQIEQLYDQGRVTSVWLQETRSLGLPFRPWAYGEMLAWLNARRIPVWIPLPHFDADDLVSTLRDYPDLPVVLAGAHYTHHMLVRPLLRALPNAHLELSRYETIGAIEQLCGEFGADRLVYGSWYARYAMGPMLFYLHTMALTEAQLAAICAGNLARILATATPPTSLATSPTVSRTVSPTGAGSIA